MRQLQWGAAGVLYVGAVILAMAYGVSYLTAVLSFPAERIAARTRGRTMAPTASIPVESAQVVIQYTAPGQSGMIETVLGLTVLDMTPYDNAIHSSFVTTWENNVCIYMHTTCAKVSTAWQNSSFSGGETHTKAGTIGGNMMPVNNAYLIRKNSPVVGRHGHGFTYLTGVAEDKIDNAGVVDGTFKTAMQASLNTVLSDLDAAGLGMVLIDSTGTTLIPVNGLVIQPLVANQRKRLRR